MPPVTSLSLIQMATLSGRHCRIRGLALSFGRLEDRAFRPSIRLKAEKQIAKNLSAGTRQERRQQADESPRYLTLRARYGLILTPRRKRKLALIPAH